MPVEYSGAAFRFGHSMIRAEYEVQDGHTVPIFGRDGYEDLRGNRPIPHDLWIDWNYFFDIPGMHTPDDRNMSRKIDAQLSLPLTTLPPTVVAPTADAIISLAERNLLRGKRLGLPSGQDVATAMGLRPLTNEQLGLTDRDWKRQGKAQRLTRKSYLLPIPAIGDSEAFELDRKIGRGENGRTGS